MENTIIIANNFQETIQAGIAFAQKLNGSEVIALSGDLGAGKTTFMQGVAKGLGVKKHIISPTFIIMRTYSVYNTSEKSKIKNLYHVDLYRIETELDVDGLGLIELLGEEDNVVAIEWPDKIEKLLPKNTIRVNFEYLGDEKRKIIY